MIAKITALLTALCSITALACSAQAADQIDGIITEIGFGAFNVTAASGTDLRLHESNKTTVYTPENWRPQTGDKVHIEFTEEYRRDRSVLMVDQAKLIEPGPETHLLESPLNAIIEEAGRSGYRARLPDYGNQVHKFITSRETTVSPPEWSPSPGDTVKIHFETQAARFGFGLSYLITQIERSSP
jgi:hypothetical protein